MGNATLQIMLMIGNNEEVVSMTNYFRGFLGVKHES